MNQLDNVLPERLSDFEPLQDALDEYVVARMRVHNSHFINKGTGYMKMYRAIDHIASAVRRFDATNTHRVNQLKELSKYE